MSSKVRSVPKRRDENIARECTPQTAEQFGVAEGLLQQLVGDPEHAPIEERLKALLTCVKKLTHPPSHLLPAHAEALFAAGWNERALEDALSVCGLFNCMNRLVEGLGVTANAGYFNLASERLASGGSSGLLKFLPQDPGHHSFPDGTPSFTNLAKPQSETSHRFANQVLKEEISTSDLLMSGVGLLDI